MEQGRGQRLTADRALVVAAIAVLVLLAFAFTREYDLGSVSGGPKVTPAVSREQTPRDWVTLFIVPLTLAGVGYLYTSYQTRRSRAIEKTRSEEDRIGTFLNDMNVLIFEHDLRNSQPGSDTRRVARTRILTVLLDMGSERKRRPLKAVYELGIVGPANQIVSLDQADLDGADLSEAVLPGIDLRGVYIRNADLTGADLRDADLRGAYLNNANLSRADLSGANVSLGQLDLAASLDGTVMPDGSTHP